MTKQFSAATVGWINLWHYGCPVWPRGKVSNQGSRLFKVRLKVNGVDDGGAWHPPSDLPLWCLRTATLERFVRASSRDEAAKLFGVTDLARKS